MGNSPEDNRDGDREYNNEIESSKNSHLSIHSLLSVVFSNGFTK